MTTATGTKRNARTKKRPSNRKTSIQKKAKAKKVKVRKTLTLTPGRVYNMERAALLAGDTELAAAIKMASGQQLSDVERTAAIHASQSIQSGMFGNVFTGYDRAIAARFDTALTTDDNRQHWAMADGLAADAAANPMIRYVLRNRARYEAANNSYCRGMIDTHATDLIGTGPRLQMNTGDERADEWIEQEFGRWCRAVKLPEKLRTMDKAKLQDGEAFALIITNPNLPCPVKLDIRTIEADQVRFVDITLLNTPSVDGICFDDYGNPVSYHVLRVHPGFWSYATGYIGFPWEYDVWPAKFVLHWFRQDRAGQHRGLPEILAALPLFAQLRRYKLAVIQTAETAACFSMWMKTPTAVDTEMEDDEVVEVPNPFDLFPLTRNIVTTLPDGYDIGQTKSEQPTTTYEMFERAVLREIGRCQRMPYNVVSGDASQANYSANNLDNQNYFRSIDEGHKDIEYNLVDRVLAAWLFEARDARTGGNGDFGSPYMPAYVRRAMGNITGNAADLPNHTYNWVTHEWANPEQQAQADEIGLRMGTETYARVWGRKGQDYRKAHLMNAKALGLTIEEYQEKILIPNLLSKPGSAKIAASSAESVEDDVVADKSKEKVPSGS